MAGTVNWGTDTLESPQPNSAMATPNESLGGGIEALHRLKAIDPPLWLSPSPELSRTARSASQHLFSSLKPFTPKSPFDHLLIDGFDAEQIWQQIDLQSQPLISSLRRQLNRFEKNPGHISEIFGQKKVLEGDEKVLEEKSEGLEKEGKDFDGVDEDDEIEGFDDEDDEEGDERGDEDGEDGEEEEDEEREEGGGIEDKFLKIKDLEEYLEEDEAREYGLKTPTKKKKGNNSKVSKDDEEEEEGEDDDEEDGDEEDDELGEFGRGDDENAGVDKLETARYEDFFGAKKKQVSKKKSKLIDGSEDSDMGDEQEDDEAFKSQKVILSTHEQELAKLRSNIEQMEKANLEPRTWTMQGEVTAVKRPKNSALEVDLDFEHNVRPAPIITEEVTASLEDLIQKKILEGRFDDVQKAPSLPSKAPREFKELDENKSKKGLAEIYEEEYVQKTGLDSTPLSFSDEQKREISRDTDGDEPPAPTSSFAASVSGHGKGKTLSRIADRPPLAGSDIPIPSFRETYREVVEESSSFGETATSSGYLSPSGGSDAGDRFMERPEATSPIAQGDTSFMEAPVEAASPLGSDVGVARDSPETELPRTEPAPEPNCRLAPEGQTESFPEIDPVRLAEREASEKRRCATILRNLEAKRQQTFGPGSPCYHAPIIEEEVLSDDTAGPSGPRDGQGTRPAPQPSHPSTRTRVRVTHNMLMYGELKVVHGLLVRASTAPYLERIIKRYGAVDTECRQKSQLLRGFLAEMMVLVTLILHSNTAKSLTTEDYQFVEDNLADLESINFRVDWLRSCFERVKPLL